MNFVPSKPKSFELSVLIWTVLNATNSMSRPQFFPSQKNIFRRQILFLRCWVSSPFPLSKSFPRLAKVWLCFPFQSLSACGKILLRGTRVSVRRKLSHGSCRRLYQASACSVRSLRHYKKSNHEIHNRYLSIENRRGHTKAIISIARMLLTTIYNIFKKNEPFNAGYLYSLK